MAILSANFKSDLIFLTRLELAAEWGSIVQDVTDGDIVLAFLDSRRRRPSARPRKVWIADDFICPPAHAAGWHSLQTEIVQGIALVSRMSRLHASLANDDGLLNEWNVHHFHLGTSLKADGSGLIERTGPVVFARVTDNDFYAINVYEHGEWEEFSILESLHHNWPETIRQYRLQGIKGEPITEKQRRNLRKVNAQVATEMADGTVYGPIGGGVMSSGDSARARTGADMLESDVERLQVSIQEQLETFLPHLRASGYNEEPTIKAVLTNITPQGFQVEFPDYGAGFNVTLEGGWFH